jgi:hypothetical protein
MSTRIGRIATGLALAIGVTGATASGIAIKQNTAQATVSPGANPWNYTMTIPTKDGMSVKGIAGSLNQIFTVKDPYGAPIVSVGHVGGLSVFGDQIRVFAPNTLDNPVAVLGFDGRLSLQGPNAGVYVNGQLLTAEDISWIHSHE